MGVQARQESSATGSNLIGPSVKRLTIFTFGYYGWGSATRQLLQAVDAVEASRGFEPPVFVDIRISRAVRAKGFDGGNFEKLLGPNRHQWMKSLGNKAKLSGNRRRIQIADPSTASELLDLALECRHQNRQVIFFCSCDFPKIDGKDKCHRATVASLLLQAAKKRGVAVEIVEWPGGKPQKLDLEPTAAMFSAVQKGRMSIPLRRGLDLATVAGMPWGSIAALHADGEKLYRLVGPVMRQKGQWVLPVIWYFHDPTVGLAEYRKEAAQLRQDWGLNPVTV